MCPESSHAQAPLDGQAMYKRGKGAVAQSALERQGHGAPCHTTLPGFPLALCYARGSCCACYAALLRRASPLRHRDTHYSSHAFPASQCCMPALHHTALTPGVPPLTCCTALCLLCCAALRREEPVVFNTYQCYLKDSYDRLLLDLERAKREVGSCIDVFLFFLWAALPFFLLAIWRRRRKHGLTAPYMWRTGTGRLSAFALHCIALHMI